MTSPEFSVPAVNPFPQPAPTIGGPCAPARAEVDARCADAEGLAEAARTHSQRLREARRQLAEAMRQRDLDSQLRDRRRMNEEKIAAQSEYRDALSKATDLVGVQGAAALWLRRVDGLNRQARLADDRADALAQRVSELQRDLPALELAADAARISAEAVQVACLEARRTLAACEEDAARRSPSAMRPLHASLANASVAQASVAPAILGNTAATPTETESVTAAARALMAGDRQTMLGLALRLAEETGIDAGRLQLLLIELREQIQSKATEEYAFSFPQNHPFWSQFETDMARSIAASLASLGFRFDGVGGWVDGRIPQIRDLALALSYCGYDPRTLRRPAGQAAIDGLWQGTTLRADEYLLTRAPDLVLSQVVSLLGPRAGRLAELWDIWGRLRPLLMRA